MQFFLHYIQSFFSLSFGVLFARARTLACGRLVLLLCSALLPDPYARVRAFSFPFFPAFPPPLSLSFSLKNIFLLFHLISPQTSTINQSITHSLPLTNTIPQYSSVLLLTLQRRKITALFAVLHAFAFFVSLLPSIVVRPVSGAPHFGKQPIFHFHLFPPFAHSTAPLITSHHNPHTFFRKFHTYKHIHTQSYSPHPRLYHHQHHQENVKRKKSALTPLQRAA